MRRMAIIAAATASALAPNATAQSGDGAAAVVQNHVDAYRSGDLDRFVATFSKDATVVGNGVVAKGRSEIRAFYAPNFVASAPTIRIADSSMVGKEVYLSIAYIFADGSEQCCSSSYYTVRGGKISRLEVTM